MKKILSMFLSLVLFLAALASIPVVDAEMHNSGVETIVTMTDGSEKTINNVINLSTEGYKLKNAEELELQVNGQDVLKINLAGNGSGNSNYLSVSFPIPDTSEEAFLAGLTTDNVNEIQSKLIAAYKQGGSFKISDLSFIDAEKTGDKDGDDQLCWAATASNMLMLTGWGQQAGFESEDDLFETFISNYSNKPGNAFYGLAWFFNGARLNSHEIEELAQINNYPNSGAYLNNYNYSMFCDFEIINNYTQLEQAFSSLSSGCGVGVGVDLYNNYEAKIGGHAITLLGYVVDKSCSKSDINYYKYILASDSDSDELSDQDRRQSENVITAHKLKGFQDEKLLGFQYGSISAIINGYQTLAPFVQDFGEETSSKATKNLRTTTDMTISNIYIGNTPGNQDHKTIFNDSDTIYLTPLFLNDSDVVVPENSKYNFQCELLNKSNNDVVKENATLSFDGLNVFYATTFLPMDYVKLNNLKAGDYTVTLTITPQEGVKEAYLINNVFQYDFSVIDPNTENQTATITIYGLNGQSETKEFNVGDTFTVYTSMNAAEDAANGVANINGSQTYTDSILSLNDAVDTDGSITDTNDVFPIIGDTVIGRLIKNGSIQYNASAPTNGSFKFNSDDDLLIVTSYTVTAGGTGEVRNVLTTVNADDEHLTKLVDHGEFTAQGQHVTVKATFDKPEHTEDPTEPATEEPTEEPTEAPTEAPHVHTPASPVRENEVPATCQNTGSYDEVIYCSDCGEELSRTPKTITKLDHTPLTAVKENEEPATCTKKGSYDEVVYCKDCGNEISRTTKENAIDPNAHTPGAKVTENENSPTCTGHGSYDEVIYCSACGEELSRNTKDVPSLGHDLIHHEAKAATCTEKGWKAYDTCSRCNHTTYEELSPLGHALTFVQEVPATYENDGVKAHYICSHCHKTFLNANGTGETTDNELVIPKLTSTEPPTEMPTEAPTEEPTSVPTEPITDNPTEVPTEEPTSAPITDPTEPEPIGQEETTSPTEESTEGTTENPTEASTTPATPDEVSPSQSDPTSETPTTASTPDEVKSDWPKTGANTQIPVWIIITIVSLVGVIGTPVGYYLQRRKRKVFRK